IEPTAFKSYISKEIAIEWNEVRYDPLVKQLLKTIEGGHMFHPVRQKEHITRTQLQRMRNSLNFGNTEGILFWSIALVAFYGLARLGELLPQCQQGMHKIPKIQS
ncbi:18530_t:CDS:2, partial [Racocetra persica]